MDAERLLDDDPVDESARSSYGLPSGPDRTMPLGAALGPPAEDEADEACDTDVSFDDIGVA